MQKILFVDREKNNHIIKELKEKGFSCEEVISGETALKLIEKKQYDLVLYELRMPKLNGMNFIKKLEDLEIDVPVIILSALKDINSVRVVLKEGAYDYITKPIHFKALMGAINQTLEKKRLRDIEKNFYKKLELQVEKQRDKIKQQCLQGIIGLVKITEEKDKYTKNHSSRVSELSVKIAKKMQFKEKFITKIKIAGLLHDLGIIAIPDDILNKPSSLTTQEMDVVKTHSTISAKLLTYFLDDEEVIKMVRHHHERWEGNGYPDGLVGEQIPLGARILAVADSYDAMTSPRPYRVAMSKKSAIKEIVENSGTQFDKNIVKHAVEVFNNCDE